MKKDMKKILFAMPLFAMLLVACDPIVDEISPDPNVTPENLTFELVAKNQGNNNIRIVPTPSRYVKVYDATSDTKLAEGTAPSVQVAPPNKELQVYITAINSDGSITKSASKSIAVTEYTDLPAIYADIFGTIPVAEALLAKGAQLGTILAFMMAVTTLSLPSMIMLKKAVKPKLLTLFIVICTTGIILVGYLFNVFHAFFI